ncbi:MAG TPA: RNA polymerase sigma factor [Candidatus Cybelea sp.]|nr:RNA polymerase sigma factor [Candidatus Cybelea sp.]
MIVDAELIESAKRNAPAMDRLIEAVWPQAYRLAWGILRDRGLAEDAAQEAAATIARRLHALENAGAFSAWSYRIAVNCALTLARRWPTVESLPAVEPPQELRDPGDALDLYNALAALTPTRRALVLLHYYAGLNSRELAAACGLPASTVRFHLMLARRALRKALATGDERARRISGEVISDVR